jgi:hypothetical protein
MRGTERRADREARGGAGTGRRSAAVGERVALGGGGGEGGAGTGRRAAAGGREARIQEEPRRARGCYCRWVHSI